MLYSNMLSLWLQGSPLTKPLPISRQLILQQAHGQMFSILPLLVSLWFHGLFHSPDEVLFTFPSRYCFAIGHPRVFSLTRWSSQIHTGFHVPHVTRDSYFDEKNEHRSSSSLSIQERNYRTLTFFGTGLSCFMHFMYLESLDGRPDRLVRIMIRGMSHNRFGLYQNFRLFPFRSPLLRESLLLFFPLATKMFQFTRLSLPFL